MHTKQKKLDFQPVSTEGIKREKSAPRAIECEDFPFESLSRIAECESWRKEIHRPIYHVHKWWAKRLGSVFRGILIGSLMPKGTDLLASFYSDVRFPDAVVFDPFMGSGTTLGETLKLDGKAIGRDINPVSYLQVRTAFTLNDTDDLLKTYYEIEQDVSSRVLGYYKSVLPNGTLCDVLYYFWVMQAVCPECNFAVDLFSSYVFAKHAYAHRNPTVQVFCPNCGNISPVDRRTSTIECNQCGHRVDVTSGPAKGKAATCPKCYCNFSIANVIRASGSPPSYRMYAKLILTPDGQKEYHPIVDIDTSLYRQAINDQKLSSLTIPQDFIKPGYNTDQVLNYGFRAWKNMFNDRQLLCISILANRIKGISDIRLRDAFTCLFSGCLEFNNMFASYKGEGTGAVRHMFNHHILKPERTPLEANLWGTSKSSGAFSTLFRSRILRAAEYCRDPFELSLSSGGLGKKTQKVGNINKPILGISNCENYKQFELNRNFYVSCGDSSTTDLPNESVDVVVTDPPFFDNVHYSQLADFFYAWQKLIVTDYPSHKSDSTRSECEVQNSDASTFTRRLTLVFKELERVLKSSGLLVFTFHHSRWEGWRSVLTSIAASGFCIVACHPVKSEMSVATPKKQAKAPINFDIIVVCRKERSLLINDRIPEENIVEFSIERASLQIERLRNSGWKLSRNDIGVVVMGQVIATLSMQRKLQLLDELLDDLEVYIDQATDRFNIEQVARQ